MIFLGVDIGSTGCKCVAFSDAGTQLSSAYREYPQKAGSTDLDADVLRESALSVIAECVAGLDDARDVAAVAFSSFGESFVPLDERGEPMWPIIMFFADRGAAELNRCVEAVGAEKIMRITRTMPDTMYSLPKISYVSAKLKKRVWKYMQMTDYLVYTLSGEAVMEYTLACRTLAFDVEKRVFCNELLASAGITADQMPFPLPSGTVAGKILPEMADRLGLPGTTRVVLGAQDQVTAALGAGVRSFGEAVDGTGTVECVTPLYKGILRDLSFTRKNYVCIPYPVEDGYVTYAFNFSGGALVKWFRDTLAVHLCAEAKEKGVSAYDLLNHGCPQKPTDMLVVPHFLGAGGTPDMVKRATGTICGLKMDTSLYDIYRGILEGLSFEMAYNLEMLDAFGIRVDMLRAVGGGARSAAWLQIKADVFSRPIIPICAEEAGAAGSAMLASMALGHTSDLREAGSVFVRAGDPILPISENVSFYAERFAAYKKLRAQRLDEAEGRAAAQ